MHAPLHSMTESQRDRRRWFALAVIVTAQFMVVLDVAIVNVALPTIKRNKTRSVRVKLNKRGRRVLHDGSRVKVEVKSKDKQGNGWRSSKTVRVR